MIKELHLVLEHFDDWTVVTEDLDRISLKSIGFTPRPPNYNLEVLLASGDKGQLLELTEKLRKRKLNAVRKVLYLNHSPNGNTAEIAMLGDFQSSIRRRLIERGDF